MTGDPIEDFIYVADDALPVALCDELMHTLDQHPATQPGVTARGVIPECKSSLDLTIDMHAELKGLYRRILDTVLVHLTDYFIRYPFVGSLTPCVQLAPGGEVMELNMENIGSMDRATMTMLVAKLFRCGTINIQKYPAVTGGYPRWHCEITADPTMESLHRIVLWMYYLNDVDAGGETEFYFQGRAIQPRKGRLVIAPAGFTHTHRGNAPLSGDKYILTSWALYQRPDKPPQAPSQGA